MKKYLIFTVIMFCVVLQSNLSMCAENKEGWRNWLYYKLFVKADPDKKQAPITPVDLAGYSIGLPPGFASDLAWNVAYKISPEFVGAVATVQKFVRFAENVREITLMYQKKYAAKVSTAKAEAVEAIKNNLKIIISNALLYPTRSSEVNVLLKKDEFLQYIDDQDNLLQDACGQLLNEINSTSYSDVQYAEDQKIDGYISKLKEQIFVVPSLEGQIVVLERMYGQQKTIKETQGYLSLYFRLKNQLELEKKLTPEQKAFRSKTFQKVSEEKMKKEELERLAKGNSLRSSTDQKKVQKSAAKAG